MDLSRLQSAEYQLSHRHKDGSWAEMVEAPLHHGAAEHDPERGWSVARLFRCRTCDEGAIVTQANADGEPIDPK